MNSESAIRASPETVTITAVNVELEGYLREKTKFSRDRVLYSLIKAPEVVTD